MRRSSPRQFSPVLGSLFRRHAATMQGYEGLADEVPNVRVGKPLVYENAYFAIRADGAGLELRSSRGAPLLEKSHFSLATCIVCNLREPLPNGSDRARVDSVDGIGEGDELFVLQDIWGGLARRREPFRTTVVRANRKNREVVFSPPVPSSWFSHSTAIYLLKRSPIVRRSALVSSDLALVGGIATLSTVEDLGAVRLATTIACRDGSPRIDVSVDAEYKEDMKLYELALVFAGAAPLSQIYLKNRFVETVTPEGPSEDDYWLWKEGCLFSDGSDGCYTLHNPGVAAVELRGARGDSPQLHFVLEHYHAQRFRRHVKLHEDGWDEFAELSAPHYRRGSTASYSFTLNAGPEPITPPRLMLSPHGFTASHAWTEHADKTHVRSHRAVYYGHEDIEKPADAIAGFVYHGHPVTKSIYFDNFARARNPPSESDVRSEFGEMTSYAKDDEFRKFVEQLHELGHEICLHTSDHSPVDRFAEERALGVLTPRFKSNTWIDHNMQYSRTGISSEGLIGEPQYAMGDLWRSFKIRNFWHFASEDFMLKNRRNVDLLHQNRGHATRTPIYWRHPTVLGPFVSWAATEAYLEHFGAGSIDALVANRGISIHHGYYAFLCREARSFLYYYRDLFGKLRITEKFDQVLAYMSDLRDKRELLIATVGDLMDYWLSLETVEVQWTGRRAFAFVNRADRMLKGLSFVVSSAGVRSDDVAFSTRQLEDGDLVAWFDLDAGTTARFEMM